jgi:hypothetical protein
MDGELDGASIFDRCLAAVVQCEDVVSRQQRERSLGAIHELARAAEESASGVNSYTAWREEERAFHEIASKPAHMDLWGLPTVPEPSPRTPGTASPRLSRPAAPTAEDAHEQTMRFSLLFRALRVSTVGSIGILP